MTESRGIYDTETGKYVDENDNPIGEPTVATDPAVQQVLDQNALIADAQFDIVRMLQKVTSYTDASGQPTMADLLQDAKTKVNALNPGKYTFK